MTLTMLKKRERFKLHIGNYQRSVLRGQKPKAAVLVKRKDGSYYLQVQLESEPPQLQESKSVLGIDLGRTDIAVTSSGEKFSGKKITQVRDKYSRVRLPRSKTERRRSNSWSFYQLRQFLFYKSIKFGVKLHFVDPRYTSKSCHCCGVIGNRQGKKFSCVNLACGWVGDADGNGSKNISALGVTTNSPRGSSTLFCSLQNVMLRATENPNATPSGGLG